MNRTMFVDMAAVGVGIVVAGMVLCGGPVAIASAQAEAHSTAETDTSTWKTYRSEKHGFELKYPGTWSVHEASGSMEGLLICRTPQPDAKAGVQFAIQRKANSDRLSVEGWLDNELRKVKATSLLRVPMTIGGKPAVRIQMGDTDEVVMRLNATDMLNIFYPESQSKSDPTYAAILSTLKFL